MHVYTVGTKQNASGKLAEAGFAKREVKRDLDLDRIRVSETALTYLLAN